MRKKIDQTKTIKKAKDIGIFFEPLEPRLLLSGSWGAGVGGPSPDSPSGSTSSFGPETVTLSASPEAFGSEALLQNQHALGAGTFVDVLANAPVLDAFDTASAADAVKPVIEASPTSNQTAAETGETATNLNETDPEPQHDMMDADDSILEANYLSTPLAFEQNVGQSDGTVDFLARGSGYALFLTDGDAVLKLPAGDADHVVRLNLQNAQPGAVSSGEQLLETRTNYLLGNAPLQWKTDVENYGAVLYDEVYEGIDLRYYGTIQRQLEYDFIVTAGADAGQIRLDFEGVESASISDNGDLLLKLNEQGNQLRFNAPISYQLANDGRREAVQSKYAIYEDGTIGFELGAYDTSRELVIDPILDYGTYLGGTGSDTGYGIAVDASGNIYVAGYTGSTDFPTQSGYAAAPTSTGDAFISKFDATGNTLLYSTYFGGNNSEWFTDIAVDASGKAYVTGYTTSTDLPTLNAYDTSLSGSQNAIIALFDTNLSGASSLLYSSYFGGSTAEYATSIALDASNNAYITGWTQSSNMPTKNAYQSSYGGTQDAFVAKFDLTQSGASSLVYSTYIGGSETDYGFGIAVDTAGNAAFTGYTRSSNFPVTANAYDNSYNGADDVFVAKLNSTGDTMVYATFMGSTISTVSEQAQNIALDSSGNIYITGFASHSTFPTTAGAYDTTFNGGTYDAFVAKFDPSLSGASSLVYSTFFGGDGNSDTGLAIAVDSSGKAYVTGRTSSTNLPTTGDAHDSSLGGSMDGFLATLSSDGADLDYLTYLGGDASDVANDIALGSNEDIYLTGYSSSSDFPTTAGAYDEVNNGQDAFVVKFASGPVLDLDANDSSGAAGNNFTTRFTGTGAVAVADNDATIADPLSTNLVSLTVTLTNHPDGANEVLTANTAGTSITAIYNSGTGVLSLTGTDTLAHYQQVLRTVTYNNTTGSPNTSDRIITFVADDGTQTSGTATTTVKLANLPPFNTVPGEQTATAVGTVVFSVANGNAISVSDPDAGSNPVQVTLTATQGTLTLAGITGLTFTTGDGTADATMTFTGTIANINTALNGMAFNGDPFRTSGTGSVQIVSDDLGNTGLGGAQSDTDTVTVNMVPLGTPYMITGTYTGNGGTLNITGLGFQPDVVIIKETSNNKVAVIKTSTMSGADSKVMTGATATATNNITSLDADGFTVSNGGNIANINSQTYTFIAFKSSPGVTTVGSYSGTGVDGNAVTGLGFSPELVFVFDGSNQAGIFRNSADANSYDFTKNAYTAAITSLDASGFTLGADQRANKNGDTYYYIAWNQIPGLMKVGSYTGNAVDDTNITGAGFAPEWLMVQSSSGSDPAVNHTEAQGASTDISNYFTGTTSTTNLIQQLQADGFQVGNNADVNANGTYYSYMAWSQETGPTISAIANQSTPEDTSLGPIAFTVGDAETAAGSLSVKAVSSNQAVLTDANIVFGGSGSSRTLTLTPVTNALGTSTVTVYVSDGEAQSSTVFTLTVTAPPVVTTTGTTLGYAENGAATAIDPGLTVSDADSTNLTGATVTITGNFASGQDVLAFTNQLGITGSWSAATGVLTLTGTTTVANYQIALRSVTYVNTSENPSTLTRTVAFVANDGLGNGVAATRSISVAAVNDAPTFIAGGGKVTTDVGEGTDNGQSVTVQADGKIVVAGYAVNGGSADFAVTRYNADGTLDTSFNGTGKVSTGIGAGNDYGAAMAVQADGKILVAGRTDTGPNYQFGLVRYNADGTLDTSFNGTGKVTTTVGSNYSFANDITVQADGKILLAGYMSNGGADDFALVRYNSDGTLDTSFNGTGKVTTPVGTSSDIAKSVTVQADGKIVVVGTASGTGATFAVVRYNANGSLDTTFNGTGKVLTAFAGSTGGTAYAVQVQADGKILVAGSTYDGTQNDFAVARYNTNGSLDTSFNGTGMVKTAVGTGNDVAYGMALQADGKIVLAGYSIVGSAGDFATVRYNTDGSLDTSFDGDGKLTTPIGTGADVAYGVAVTGTGQIVLAGSSSDNFALAAYDTNGSLNGSFGLVNTLDGAPAFTENGAAVVLDADVQVFDAELSALDSFAGATLTLVRNGGANVEDVFSATGSLATLTESGSLVVGGTTIGTVTTNSAGTLVLTFTADATNTLVNQAMQQIAYNNTSETPPATVQIDWTFDDGNTGAQGTGGGALSATGSTTITITEVNDTPVITSNGGGPSASINVAENTTTVTTVTATDADLDTLTYSIDPASADAALFGIDVNTGVLTFNSAPNFEAPADADSNNVYEVTVQVSDGNGGFDTQAISVAVTDMLELAVTNTNATGTGSLHEAILNANANTGVTDTITFNIAGVGPHVINLTGALPAISDTVIIDGATNPGYAGDPIVRIDGSSAGAGVSGLTFAANSDNSVVRGLMITGFTQHGIQIDSGADGITITNNWIGTSGTGSTGVGNGDTGINIQGANTIVGGTGANEGNVITNNGNEGINVTGAGATGTIIQGNIIGLDPDGVSGSGNTDVGIALLPGAHNTTIGGTTPEARNIISMNREGIEINSNNNTVQGNYIGTDISGTLDRGNRSDDGIEIQGGATGNLIGGESPGAGNIIAFNALNGVNVVNGSTNAIVRNSIHSNTLLGINLGTDGATANDNGDGDSGANNLQNFPVLTNAETNGSQITITGSLNSTPSTSFRIEFYANATGDGTGHGEGQTLIGISDVTTDGSGNASFSPTFSETVSAGSAISAIVSRLDGGDMEVETSEFAQNVTAVVTANTAPTFAVGVGDGIVTTPIGSAADSGKSVTAQPDGKILLAGYSWNGSNYDFALTRYNVDGTLDTSFSTDGKVTTSIGVGSAYGQSVAVQTDGKILVGGYAAGAAGDEYALARYNSDGSLDTSFSGDGIVTTSFGLGDAYGESLTLQADGKILVSGYFYNGAANLLSLARYNADGSLDTSFSGDGLLTTSFGGVDNYGWDVAVQSDGAIVVVGSSSAGGTPDFAVARYDSSGNLDMTFSGDGLLTTPIGAGIDQAYSVTIQDDGKLLVAGYSFNGTDNDFAIVRYNSNGTLDTSFGGGDGIVTTAVGVGNDAGYSLTVQADGKILVAGLSLIGGNNDFALVRYNSNGTLDTSFGGGDGIATTVVGAGNDGGYSVMVQADGKIVVAGTSNNGSNDDFAVVRYNSDGTLDTGFDSILANTLNGAPTFTEDGVAVVLDADVQIFDAELSALDNFSGTTLTLARNGGANAQDVFSATGTLSALTQGGNLVVGGTAIGMVTTNSGGTLVLTFNASATNTLVNSAMQQIAYSNSSDTPPASVQIDWTFNDGNTGAQGTGGALSATGSTTVTITAVNDAPIADDDFYSVTEDASLVEPADGVLLNDADVDGDTITAVLVNGPSHAASFTLNSDGSFSYTPDADWNGSDSFTYRASDGTVEGNVATVTITVSTVNDSPTSADDSYTVDEDATLTVGWWDTDWTRRQQLTLDNLAQSETLTDIPVLIVLNSGNIDYTQTKDDGSDLRFFAADGTPLACEIEQWNEGGDSSVWVRIPQITGGSNTDGIWMYYGNAAATSASDPAGVWDSNFVGVWHLNEEQAGIGGTDVYEDSTSHGNHGIDWVAAAGQEGQITDGQEFGSNDWIEIAHDTSLDLKDSMTISFWIKPTSDSGTFSRVVEKGLWGYNNSYYFGGGDGTNDLTFYLNGQEVIDTADGVLTVGVWQHAAVSYTSNGDGTGTARLYLNGLEIATGNYTNGVVAGNTERLAIGHPDPLYDFDGFIDEVQISNIDRSADWIAAQFKATKNQFGAEFVQFGGEQVAPALGGVLGNDTDVDGDTISAVLVSGPSHAADFTLNADGSFSYTPEANWNGSDSFTYKANDGTTDGNEATVTITVNPVNDNPAVINLEDDVLNYTEGDGAVIIEQGSDALVTDIDSSDFAGGTLNVEVDSGLQAAEDVFSIRNQGTAGGQIGVSGSDVTYGGILIGTWTGGTGVTPLTVTFNANATPTAVTALVRNITYENSNSENPTAGVRSVTIDITDGDGGACPTQNLTINVTAVNDAPTVGTPAGYSATEQVSLDLTNAQLTVDDVDHNGGILLATLSVGEGTLSATSGDSGVTIVSGNGTSTLVITGTQIDLENLFSGASTGTLVYLNASDNPGSSTPLTITLNDQGNTGSDPGLSGDGTSEESSASIQIDMTPVNDVPIMTTVPPDVTFVEGGMPQRIDDLGTVVDVDSPDFDGGVLTVSITQNASADDRLTVHNVGTGPGEVGVSGSNVTYGGTVVGSFSGGTGGSDPLIVTFNTNATQAAVQAVRGSIQFSNVSDTPSTLPRQITFELTDGDGGTATPKTKLVYVQATNDAPTVANPIPDQVATEDAPFTFTFAANTFNDPDVGDTLTYTSDASGWLSFDAATRTFSGTPLNADVGTVTVTVTADDGNGGTVSDTFDIVVGNSNDAPTVANPIPDQAATEDTPFTFTFAANTFADVDVGDTLTYTSDASGWLSFDAATRTFTGTPLNADVGTVTVTVTADDGNGGTVSDTFDIVVGNSNDAPTVANPIPDQVATEDTPFTFTFAANTFADVDVGDTLTYTSDASGWLSFNAATRTFTGTPLNADVGTVTVTVTADDGNGGTVSDTFDIVVGNTNDAPTVANPIADQVATEDTPFTFTFAANTFNDPDVGDTLTYTSDASGWLSFNAGTRTFSGTPLNADVGTVTVTVTADDGNGGTVSDTFDIVVGNSNDAPTVANPIPDQAATEDTLFSFQFAANTFADVDAGDTLTYTSDASGWLSFNAATRTFTGTPLNADVGTVTVTVTADDGNGGTVSDTFDIVVGNSNDAPTVANPIPDQAATEDTLFSFQFAANTFADVDAGDTLTYTSDASGWLSFDAATRTFSGTPLNADVGTVTVTVTADDGNGGTVSDTFDIVVGNSNDAPTVANPIPDQAATEDTLFSFQFAANTFADVDAGDTLTYTSDASGWLSFDSATRTFSGTPLNADVGTVTVTVTADDGNGGTVSDTFDIVVGNSNDAPTVANPIPDQVATEDTPFTFTFAANTFADVDVGDTLTYTSDAAGWLSFDAAIRTFTGTPLNADVGTVTVTVTADDGNGGTVSDTFDIVVGNSNDAPTVANPIPDQVATEDAPFSFTFAANTFADVDVGDTLTYTSDASGWLSFDAATRTFTGTPLNADVGTVTVTVTADDGNGGTVSDTFDIVVGNSNDAPTVANPIPDQAATEDTLFSFQFAANTFADIDAGDTLTYTSDASGWLSFDAATRTFSGTPLNADVGTVTVTVTADDGNGGTVSDTFDIVVGNSNDAPTVANPIPDQVATEDTAFSFQFAANTFADIDAGDTLTYTSDASGWLSFDAATRTFSGTPLNADVGTVTVTVTADDGNGGTVSDTFDIVVGNSNDAPTVANPIADQAATEDASFSFTFAANTFNDLDGDTLTYTSDASGWLSFDAAIRTFTGTPLNADVGTVTVTVTADDGNGGTVSDTFDIVVGNSNDAPTVANPIPDQVATEDAPFSFTFAANTFADVDVGDTLTYTSDASGWLSFNAATRTFTGTPLNADVGTVTVTVTADDGNGGTVSDSFDIVVGNSNDAPTVANPIPDQVATEDTAFSFQFAANTFADVDAGDTLTYTSDASGWLSFDAATRTFSGTPLNADVGTVTVTVTADDGNGGTVSDTFDIVVGNSNDAPTVANPIADQAATEDAPFTFTFAANTFNDLDGDTLTYTSDASGWLSFDAATRTFSGTPLNADVGTVTMTVTADDGNGGTVSDTFDIVVGNSNDAPTVANPIPDQVATEDTAFSFQFAANTFADVDAGDTLTYTSDTSGWLSFDAATRTFSGTPLNADVGTVTVTVTADDGNGGTVSDTFDIVVGNSNDAPTVANPIADQAATEDAPFTFTFAANTFNDLDGDTLTYTSDASGWLSFDAATRTFSGTPLNADVGTVTMTVTADDGNGGTVSDTFDIVVGNSNDAPTVANPIPDQVATEDAPFTFTFAANTFNDPDVGDTLTYTSDASGWLSFDAATRTFSGTPLNADVGTVTVTVTADDGNGGTVSDTFDIVIGNANDAPTVANPIPDQAATEDTLFSFQFAANTFADVDVGDTLTYTSDASGWLSFDAATRTFTGTPLNADVGTVTVTVTADDGNGGTVSDTFDIVVGNSNDAPTGSVNIDNMTPAVGDTLSASNTLADADGLSGPISYQWYLDGVALGGATGTTYTVVPADVGGIITVVASYTDDQGTFESVSSGATAAVTNVNNAPVIGGGSTGAVTEDVDPDGDGLLEVGGVLNISDPDVGESSFQAETFVGTYGSLTIDSAGNWRYAADNSQAAIQQLNADESLTDVLTVTTADGTPHTITITINGAADGPAIDDSPGPIDEGGGDPDPDDEVDPVETEPEADEGPPNEESLPVREETGQQVFYPSDGPVNVNSQPTLPHRLVAAISRMTPVMVFRNADASPSENVGSLNILTRQPASPAERNFTPTATVYFSPEVMAQALDHLQKQLDETMELDANQGQLIIGAAAGLGASVMVGYVVWAFRGASLLLGALSAMPMWRCFDPLPVLVGDDKERDEDDEERSDEPEMEDDERRVRDLLDSEQAVNAHQTRNGRGNRYEAL